METKETVCTTNTIDIQSGRAAMTRQVEGSPMTRESAWCESGYRIFKSLETQAQR